MIKRFISHIRSVVFRHKYRRELMLNGIFWTLESKKNDLSQYFSSGTEVGCKDKRIKLLLRKALLRSNLKKEEIMKLIEDYVE